MKTVCSILITLLFSAATYADLYNQPLKSINGETLDLTAYKGKPLLVVNIATRCGYTSQLEALEKTYSTYKAQGLVVIGIPSNDFGGQTPEDNKTVQKFCKTNYGVDFPMSEKLKVTGPGKHPLIKDLIEGGSDKSEISWNFEKFLINRKGKVIGRFKSNVAPDSEAFKRAIESTL